MAVVSRMDMQSALLLRPATADDLPWCLQIDPSFETSEVWQMRYHERKGQVTVTFQTVRLPQLRRIEAPHTPNQRMERWRQAHEFFVLAPASESEPLAGYLSLTMDTVDGTAWIGDLVIAATHRRKGEGSRLLQTAVGWAKEQHATRLATAVATKNYPATQFLTKSGFSLWGYNETLFYSGDIALYWGLKV